MKWRIANRAFSLEWGLAVWLPFLSNCAIFGGGGESLQRAKGYEVKAPDTWTPQNTDRESDRAYRTPSGNVATLTSSCQEKAAGSLEVLTRHLLLGARGTVFLKEETHFITGVEGRYSSVKTTLDGNPFFLELFVLRKKSCVFDFSLVSTKELSVKEQSEFTGFFKSLTYGSN